MGGGDVSLGDAGEEMVGGGGEGTVGEVRDRDRRREVVASGCGECKPQSSRWIIALDKARLHQTVRVKVASSLSAGLAQR